MRDRARRGFTIHDPTTIAMYTGYMYMLGVGTLYPWLHELVD